MAEKRVRQLLQLPAQVIDIRPRADKSVKISFESRELTGDEAALLFDSFQGEGWLVYAPNSTGVALDEVPTGSAESGTKSQSKRLRDVIFVYWKQKGGNGDFETFYRVTLEKLIDYMKSKLEQED